MADTTAGSSLARVTIVDESGTAILDEVVRQHVPVLYVGTEAVSQSRTNEE
jgi:RNA exonuclease 1